MSANQNIKILIVVGNTSQKSCHSWITGPYYLPLDSYREIQEVFSGDLPRLHIQSHCRCPGSHPRVHRLEQQYCIPSDAEDTTKNRVLRLNPEAHPLSFVNDNNIGTSWVSHVFTNMTQLSQGVTISIDLENGQYQVICNSGVCVSFLCIFQQATTHLAVLQS